MGLLLIFQTEQNPNEKRDKPKKEDLSRSVHPIELFSKQNVETLNNLIEIIENKFFGK